MIVRGTILVLVFMLGLLIYPHSALGGRGTLPEDEHFEAFDRGRECLIYRSLSNRTTDALEQSRALLKQERNWLKIRREELEQCGREKGLGGSSPAFRMEGEAREALLAELCTDQYELWLSPGYRVQLVKEDIRSLKGEQETVDEYLREYCTPWPPPNAYGQKTQDLF